MMIETPCERPEPLPLGTSDDECFCNSRPRNGSDVDDVARS